MADIRATFKPYNQSYLKPKRVGSLKITVYHSVQSGISLTACGVACIDSDIWGRGHREYERGKHAREDHGARGVVSPFHLPFPSPFLSVFLYACLSVYLSLFLSLDICLGHVSLVPLCGYATTNSYHVHKSHPVHYSDFARRLHVYFNETEM